MALTLDCSAHHLDAGLSSQIDEALGEDCVLTLVRRAVGGRATLADGETPQFRNSDVIAGEIICFDVRC